MKRYTDLFIDFDDTIYDTRGNAQLSLQELYDHYRLYRYFAQPEDFFVPYWQTNEILWEQYSQGLISRDQLIVERFRRPLAMGQGLRPTVDFCLQVSDYFLDCNARKPGVVEGAHRVLAHLRQAGYRMHMCSNGFHEVQYRKLEVSHTMAYFDTVILSEDAGANKPSPAFFDYALHVTGAQLGTTLMIGDNPHTDIAGALGYGLDAIYFERRPAETDFPRPADHVIHKLEEIINIL